MGMESELESANEMRRSDPLAQRLADGDPKAPRELVERHRTELYRYARSLLRDGPREVSVAETPEPGGVVLGSTSGADGTVAWLDTLEALGQLSERQRVAVVLRYIEDLPYAGIAEATGWPENTCKTLVRRGIGRLRALVPDGSNRKEAGT